MVSPTKLDPTGTSSIQNAFARDLLRRFKRLSQAVWKLVAIEDAFGLAPPDSTLITTNTRWKFTTGPEKLKRFEEWLNGQINDGILSDGGGNEVTGAKYVRSAYRTGIINTYRRVRKESLKNPAMGGQYQGTEDQFIRDAFNAPENISKLQMLGTRVYSALKDVSSTAEAQMQRILAQGIADGKSPRDLGRELQKSIEGLSKARATRIARTEIVHAHAEAQLDAFEQMNVYDLTVMAEWVVTGDAKVCPQCSALEGVVLTTKEARGLLPRHPNCRCSWVPADVGESTKGQKRSKKEIEAAFVDSVTSEKPKATAADAFKLSRWLGADIRVDLRPKPLTDLPMFAPAAELWGQQPTAVMRWMGKEGWSVDEAADVLEKRGVSTSKATLKTQLAAGKKGARGAAANLTEEQANELRALRGTTPPIKPPVIKPPVITPPPITPPPPVIIGDVDLTKLDVTPTSLVRWMGKDGFDVKQAKTVLEKLNLKVSDATLRTQLAAGRKGIRGAPAMLSQRTQDALRLLRTGGGTIQPPIAPPAVKPIVPRLPKPKSVATQRVLPTPSPKPAGPRQAWDMTPAQLEKFLAEDKELNDLVKEITDGKAVREFREAEAKYNAARKAYSDAMKIQNDAVMKAAKMELPERIKYLNAIDEEYLARKKDFIEVTKEYGIKKDELVKAPHKLLEIAKDRRMEFVKESDASVTSTTFKAKSTEAQEFLSKIVSKRDAVVHPDGFTSSAQSALKYKEAQLKAGERAFERAGKVFMTEQDGTKVHVHEVGHALESVFNTKAPARFLKMRISRAGTLDEKLAEVFPGYGFDVSEVGNKDDFDKFFGKSSAYYCGKTYGDKDPPFATEVISMGLQELYSNPVDFAKKDPEYFKFIVGYIRGTFR